MEKQRIFTFSVTKEYLSLVEEFKDLLKSKKINFSAYLVGMIEKELKKLKQGE